MKKSIFILSLLSLFTLSSCNDFLDIQPKDRVIPTSLEDYRALLTSGYGYYPTNKSKTILRTDDVIIDENNYSVNAYKDIYLWKDTNYEEQTSFFSYESPYRVIFYANEVINSGGEKLKESKAKNQLLGEAYALRAYTYLELANLFAKPYSKQNVASSAVPLILTLDLEKPQKPSTLAEVYQQIESDIQVAKSLLQEEQATEMYKYRFSKIALDALAARVALYKGEWQKAVDAADRVLSINNQLLDLRNNAENMFPNQVKSLENIMALEYAVNNDVARTVMVSSELTDLYNKQEDLRFALYFSENNGKYRPNKGNSKDFKCSFRIGEILLLKAEALFKLSKENEAKEVLKTLAEKRYTEAGYNEFVAKLDTLSGQQLWQELMNERRRELAFEGYRWFDLRRNNQKQITHTFGGQTETLQQNDPKYTIAFPKKARVQNPYLK